MKALKKISKTEILFLVIATVFAIAYIYLNTVCFTRYATSDVYADMLYAMEAWDSKSIFPDGWVFGNQLYTVATPVMCAFFFGITGKAALSMVLSTVVMSLLVIISFIYLLNSILPKRARAYGIAMLLGGITTFNIAKDPVGQLLFLLASYYACYAVTVFLTLADYIRALKDKDRPLFTPSAILAYMLMLATGMQSVRQTAILTLPLICFEILRLILQAAFKKSFTHGDLKVTIRVKLYTAANIIGLIAIRVLNIPSQSIYGDIAFSPKLDEALAVNSRIIGKLTGFYYAINEPNGWIYLIPSFIFTSLALFSVIKGAVCAIKNKRASSVFCAQTVLIISLLGLFAANLLLDMSFRTTYMFLYYPLVAISVAEMISSAKRVKAILSILALLAFVFNFICGFLPAVSDSALTDEQILYSEIAYDLDEMGYEYIYGDWYTATMIALQSENNIRAYAWYGNVFEILPYINPQNKYGEDINSEAVYIVMRSELEAAEAYAGEIGARMEIIRAYNKGQFYLITSDKPLMH